MIPAFNASCKEMIKEWEKIVSKTGSGEVEMWSYLHNMSADAISRAAFGSSFQEGQRVFELLREHTSITVQALQSVYIPGSRFFYYYFFIIFFNFSDFSPFLFTSLIFVTQDSKKRLKNKQT